MGFTYRYTFQASASSSAEEIRAFLHDTGVEATKLGFVPCTVLNLSFDTPEKREFARRVRCYRYIEDDRLEGTEITAPCIQRHHGREAMLLATSAVVLVVTDEQGVEVLFGFAKFPQSVRDHSGTVIWEGSEDWYFSDFIDHPDPRYRRIVAEFERQGYLADVQDDYA